MNKATRSTSINPICDSQDVSRYPAHDPAILATPMVSPGLAKWAWGAVVVMVIGAVALAAFWIATMADVVNR